MIPVAPAYTISKARIKHFNKEPIPGPTDYEPYSNARGSLPSYSFNRSPRRLHQLSENPGPGNYLPEILINPKGSTIPKSPRALSSIRNLSPGPGDYNFEIYSKKYQYSISKAKYRSSVYSDSPGPGHYSPKLLTMDEGSPRTKFSTQARMPRETFITPAPGHYKLPSIEKSPGYTFAKATKREKDPPSPGPGSYMTPLNTIGIGSGRKLID